MRKGNGELINCICNCGYETGFIIPKILIKVIIKDGGKVDGEITNGTLNMRGSTCPKCKSKNSFDIEFKNTVFKRNNIAFSNIERV